jgi:hypothetical protein
MTRRTTTFTVLALALSVLVAGYLTVSSTRAERQKPVTHTEQHVDGGLGMPPTLEALWAATPLIVEATIGAAREADLVLDKTSPVGPRKLVRSAYRLDVHEVLKGDAEAGAAPIEVIRIGGDRDRGPYVESVQETGFPPFKPGERYLLFLSPDRDIRGAYVPVTNTADSAFLIDEDGRLHARGHTALAKEIEKGGRSALAERLRRIRQERAR